jgi:hypothetical protein
MLFCNKKQWNTNICYNMDESEFIHTHIYTILENEDYSIETVLQGILWLETG